MSSMEMVPKGILVKATGIQYYSLKIFINLSYLWGNTRKILLLEWPEPGRSLAGVV